MNDLGPLAARTVPGVLEVLAPEPARLRPLVVDSPHSGTHFPEDFGAAIGREMLLRHIDTAVDDLFSAAPGLGAPMVRALFARTYIDPNRAADDIDEALLSEAWPGGARPSAKSERGNGLIRRTVGDDELLYARKLSVPEVRRRIEAYHAPYHAALGGAHAALMEGFGCVYHLNCHSMGSRSGDGAVRRPDIVLGDRDGTTCESGFTEAAASLLRGRGYRVEINHVFKGVELVRAFSAPERGCHSLQIEVNKDLYLDEGTGGRSPGYDTLKGDLSALLEGLAHYAACAAAGRKSGISVLA